MAIMKCKMCGWDMSIAEGMSVADCKHCGSKQTAPILDSGKKIVLFSRANRHLWNCDFDKAAGLYQDISAEYPAEAEAYWGSLLCKYGVSYLDGPDGGKVPACHRASCDSVLDDSLLGRVLENAPPLARALYREEAKAIEKVRLDTIVLAEQEPPCDIFICHQLGQDSAAVQEICGALSGEGYRIFFPRGVQDAKASAACEPSVFSALKSARIMLAFGADKNQFNSVWIKNQWSRFLALVRAGEKKWLLPCCWGIGAQDLPRELAELEFHNMGAPGALDALMLRIVELSSYSLEPDGGPPAQAAEARGEGVQRFLGRRDSLQRISALIAAGANHTAAVQADGKVMAVGYTSDGQCSVGSWRDAVAAAADAGHTVALKLDGTVTAAGKNDFGQCNVSAWTDIVSIAAGGAFTVGLRSDGTVVATGKNDYGQCNVARWTDIVAIAADGYRTIGVKSDGTVLLAGWAATLYRSKAVAWRDIVGVASSSNHTVGVKEDGSVTAIGGSSIPQWKDIVSVSTGPHHTVGLRSDGTVVAVGDNKLGQCEVDSWTDIIAVAAGTNHTVGLRLDGTLVATGNNSYGQCEVSEWKLFDDLDAWEEKVVAAEARRQELEVLRQERKALKRELEGLKGLFTGKRRKEIEERMAEIDGEMQA